MIYNKNNDSHKEVKAPLFLGQQLGLHDTINVRHPVLEEIFQKQKALDWSEFEVDLSQDKNDFKTCPVGMRDLMIKNLAFQFELDSCASRATGSLIAPFISNPELWRCAIKIQEIEVLHAVTYSHIARMCLEDPNELIDEVYKNENIIKRANKVIDVFDDIHKLGAYFTLNTDVVDIKKTKIAILKYFAALYALERIQFMASFSATFSLVEQGYFFGIASLVQKILNDEMLHSQDFDKYVVKVLSEEFKEEYNDENVKEEIKAIIDEVVDSEYQWAEYLFTEGRSVIGLNEQLMKSWVDFNALEVYSAFGLVPNFEIVQTNPIPFMDRWMDIDKIQNANQEMANTNYRLNSYIDDTKGVIERL